MKITYVYKGSHIQSSQVEKAKANEDKNFKDMLDGAMKKEANLEDIFKDASQKYELPIGLLKAVAKVESNFNPNALSSSGAGGLMQLMPATARSLGVSDVFDPEQNINGGAKYLSQLLKRYDGDLTLTLAAYNVGPGNVAKYGGVPDFKETQNYIIKVEQALKGEGQDIGLTNYQDAVKTQDKKPIELPILKDPEIIAKMIQLNLIEELSDHFEEDSKE